MVWKDSDTTDLGPAARLPPGCVADGLVSHFRVASSTVLVIVEVHTSYDYSGVRFSVLLLVGPWTASSLGLRCEAALSAFFVSRTVHMRMPSGPCPAAEL